MSTQLLLSLKCNSFLENHVTPKPFKLCCRVFWVFCCCLFLGGKPKYVHIIKFTFVVVCVCFCCCLFRGKKNKNMRTFYKCHQYLQKVTSKKPLHEKRRQGKQTMPTASSLIATVCFYLKYHLDHEQIH